MCVHIVRSDNAAQREERKAMWDGVRRDGRKIRRLERTDGGDGRRRKMTVFRLPRTAGDAPTSPTALAETSRPLATRRKSFT